MPLSVTKALRVLWRQDISRYVPPVLSSGLVNGAYLLRCPSSSSRAPSLSLAPACEGCGGGRLAPRGRTGAAAESGYGGGGGSGTAALSRLLCRTPLPSSFWVSKYLCECPSEGLSIAAFTPCCAADVAELFASVGEGCRRARRMGTPRAGGAVGSPAVDLSRSTRRERQCELLELLLSAVQRRRAAIVGAESVQTGVPIASVGASVDAVEAFLRETIASLQVEEGPSASSAASRVTGCVGGGTRVEPWDCCLREKEADEGGRVPAGRRPCPRVVLCVTPPRFSLSHGIRAIVEAVLAVCPHRATAGEDSASDCPACAGGVCDAAVGDADGGGRLWGCFDHIVWCAAADAALSTMWFMEGLRESAAAALCAGAPAACRREGWREWERLCVYSGDGGGGRGGDGKGCAGGGGGSDLRARGVAGQGDPGALRGFSVLLTGHHVANTPSVCVSAFVQYEKELRVREEWPQSAAAGRLSVDVVSRGFTCAAAHRFNGAFAGCGGCGVRVVHSHVSTPAIAFFGGSACTDAGGTASLDACGDDAGAGEGEHEPRARDAAGAGRDVGEWTLKHAFYDQPPAGGAALPYEAGGGDGGGLASVAAPHRTPLLFLPSACSAAERRRGLGTAMDLVSYLARGGGAGLGAALRMGHSLDSTRRRGPMMSATQREAARAMVREVAAGIAVCPWRCRTGDGRDGSSALWVMPVAARPVTVSWGHVCGGLDMPLTASTAGGYFFVPAVFFIRLSDAVAAFGPLPPEGSRRGAPGDPSGQPLSPAAIAALTVCQSVCVACEGLEAACCGGTTGACVFVCEYPRACRDEVRAGVVRFVRQTHGEGPRHSLWGLAEDPRLLVADTSRQRGARSDATYERTLPLRHCGMPGSSS